MILTLRSPSGTVHIDITADQFKRLRDPSIGSDEINHIAFTCGCEVSLLKEYVEDLKQSIRESVEIDGSCDYSDHL